MGLGRHSPGFLSQRPAVVLLFIGLFLGLSRLGPQELKGESDTENDTLLGVPVGLLTVEVHLRVGTEVGFQRAPVLVRSSPRQSFNKWRSRRDKKASRTLPKSSWEWRNSTCLVFGFHGSFHKTHPT